MTEYKIEDLPKREVSPDEFRAIATKAGWKEKTIDIFLNPVFPISEYVKVGELALVVK